MLRFTARENTQSHFSFALKSQLYSILALFSDYECHKVFFLYKFYASFDICSFMVNKKVYNSIYAILYFFIFVFLEHDKICILIISIT